MESDFNLYIGKRIRKRRRLLGLTQTQLAEKIGVRFQQVQKYECGANRVSAFRLWRIAVALEVPLEHFTEGFEEKPKDEIASLMAPPPKMANALRDFARLPTHHRQKLLASAAPVRITH